MEIKDFFRFSSKLLSSTFQAHPIGLNFKSNELDDPWKLIKGNYEEISFPIVFKQAYGKKLEDILDTGWPSLYLISDKMKEKLTENELTGWKTFAVTVLDKMENEIKGYSGLSIVGRCGPVDHNKCEIIEKRAVVDGPSVKYYKGLYVGLDQWDGSDFFLPEDTFATIITRHAANVIKENKLTNIRLQNLSEIETPEYGLKK